MRNLTASFGKILDIYARIFQKILSMNVEIYLAEVLFLFSLTWKLS